jgi:hypothetical protein
MTTPLPDPIGHEFEQATRLAIAAVGRVAPVRGTARQQHVQPVEGQHPTSQHDALGDGLVRHEQLRGCVLGARGAGRRCWAWALGGWSRSSQLTDGKIA